MGGCCSYSIIVVACWFRFSCWLSLLPSILFFPETATSYPTTMMRSLGRSSFQFLARYTSHKGGGSIPNTPRLATALFSASTNPDSSNVRSGNNKKGGERLGKYSQTVCLPTTTFEQRANASVKEPAFLQWWERNQVYQKQKHNNEGPVYVIHDGPPYANGDLHIGHAMNKILKDFINKYKMLQGHKVRYVPGWDCHGLPIELKVLQSIQSKDERASLTPVTLRQRAKQFAQATIDQQMSSFKRYGVWGDWDTYYATLQHNFEAAQIRVFGKMLENGVVYRGKKPVHWSPSSQTALAEAELEYSDAHVSRSVYVGFKLQGQSPALEAITNGETVYAAIWTTTAWTLPSNLAVAVNENIEYSVIQHPAIMGGDRIIIGTKLIDTFLEKMGCGDAKVKLKLTMCGAVSGEELAAGSTYQHPLYEDKTCSIVVGGDYITTDSGTGLVHTAPGHGMEDYQTGLKYKLGLFSPVDDMGRYTAEAGEGLEGLQVLTDGVGAVIERLQTAGFLLKEEEYTHKYPYDWRTKKPTIFRATEQWFASVSDFQRDTVAAINKVDWVPAAGKSRILAMTESRGDWCISRQRAWGVPIPVFYNKESGEALANGEVIEHIAKVFENNEGGSDAWWTLSTAELLPPGHYRDNANLYTKGTDTMDVWFDSGTSWAGVLQNHVNELTFPADLYLEGSDQHRGWFQSSLLTSVASNGPQAPYKSVLTHGFVLDEKGYKMSKSLGNVVDPRTVIDGGKNLKQSPAYGADTLRWWVSSVDYFTDVNLGSTILRQSFESYRKMRNTFRFLLGSLNDFNPETDAVPYEKLASVDKYMLGKLAAMVTTAEKSYEMYDFHNIHHSLAQFSTVDLSNFYLDISKDRLYISEKNELRRRQCQTVIHMVLEDMLTIAAPLVPFLAEDVWQNLPYSRGKADSVFQRKFAHMKSKSCPATCCKEDMVWGDMRLLRRDVNKAIELARSAGQVGASLDCGVVFYTKNITWLELLQRFKGDDTLLAHPLLTNTVDDLRFIMMASKISFALSEEDLKRKCPDFHVLANESESGVIVGVHRAHGDKCERCWFRTEEMGTNVDHPTLCPRCTSVVEKL